MIGVPTGTWAGQRDRLMLTPMFNTGARVSEVIGVCVVDVVLGPASSIRLHGKGRKQRTLPLWKTTAKAIEDWLQLNPNLLASSPLLPRRDGLSMTRANVAQRLELAVNAAIQQDPELATTSVTPRVVRPSTAMSLLQAGADPCEIALARLKVPGREAGPILPAESLDGIPAGVLARRRFDRVRDVYHST